MADELRPAARVNWSGVVDNTGDPTQKLLLENVATIWFLEREELTQVTVTGKYLFQRWAFQLSGCLHQCCAFVVVVPCLYILLAG